MCLLTGCRTTLNHQQTVELATGEVVPIIVNAVVHEQMIKITAKSDNPINVHVYLSADEEEVERAITLVSSSEKILASQANETEISLAAKIPPNQEATVRISTVGSQPAAVTVSISN